MGSVPTTLSAAAGGGSIARTDTSASVGSPIYGQFNYVVKVNNNTSLSVTVTVDLGSITVRSVHQAAPTAG
jgi:hypothetical protein